jgi:hypothetical protein
MSKTLNDRYFVKVCLESIYLKNNGWLCDCGKWTTGDDKDHIPIDKGKREIYELPNSGNSKLWVMVGSG